MKSLGFTGVIVDKVCGFGKERERPQKICIDVSIETDFKDVAEEDDPSAGIDFRTVYTLVRTGLEGEIYTLEKAASSIWEQIKSLNNAGKVNIDLDMIRRVLINLIENASKFTSEGGSILIAVSKKDKNVLIRIEDNGPGIPADSLERIFNKYTRLQRENMPKGLGLGLAFCKLAVEAHGGKIWVESQENKGSKFIFSIPA